MREILRDAWADLTGPQKLLVTATILAVAALALAGWLDSAASLREVKRLEREATAAKRDAAEQLERAAKIGTRLRDLEAELEILEVEREKKLDEARSAGSAADRARDNWNSTRERTRTDNPDADALCRELAALGYPCR